MVYPPDARAPANEASARDAPFQVFETRFGCSSLRRGGRKFRLEKYFSEHSVLLRCVCMNTVCWFTTWSTEDMMTHSTTRLKVAARGGYTKPFMTGPRRCLETHHPHRTPSPSEVRGNGLPA